MCRFSILAGESPKLYVKCLITSTLVYHVSSKFFVNYFGRRGLYICKGLKFMFNVYMYIAIYILLFQNRITTVKVPYYYNNSVFCS